MYPNGEFTKEELEEIIQIALEMRRRVKEQLKKLGGIRYIFDLPLQTDKEYKESLIKNIFGSGGKATGHWTRSIPFSTLMQSIIL